MTAPSSTQRMIDRMKKSVQRFPPRRVLEGRNRAAELADRQDHLAPARPLSTRNDEVVPNT
jgi:hypothetical protein